MDLITIIVPVYNVKKYLKECLDSIINQTYKNLEIILVDDGSPDNCGKICDEYAKRDKRIKVIHKENGGLSSARNAGLDIAKGEYISFIDSDDYVAENFIEKLYLLCIQNNADIAECDFIRFENEINLLEQEENLDIYSAYDRKHIIYMKHSIACNKLYKKYLYEKLRFPIGKTNEDEFTIYKILYSCKNVTVFTNLKLYYYRYNPQSIMGRTFNIKRLDALEALEERKQFYKKRNEIELYNKTVEQYQGWLMSFYILTKDNIKDCKYILKNIKAKARKNFTEYKKNKEIVFHKKVKTLIFCFSPAMFYYLVKVKKYIYRRKNFIII